MRTLLLFLFLTACATDTNMMQDGKKTRPPGGWVEYCKTRMGDPLC